MLLAADLLLRELTAKINIFSRDPASTQIKKTEKIIQHINNALGKLKILIKTHSFINPVDEIKFYKEINPEFYSLYIYFGTIFNIQTHITPGSTKYRIKYLENQLIKIDDYFYHNLDFYKYYSSGKSELDEEYFIRGNGKADVPMDLCQVVMDREFCTPHSLKIATILANQKLKDYLNNAISDELTPLKSGETDYKTETMQWTESKVGLYELIYAFHSGKVFNNGSATIESITRYFEKIFFIELKTPTVTFQEILRRKKGLTFFLDFLRNTYLLYIEKIEERNRQKRNKP
ncbi:RteC protein [Chitinophaga niastensis]|uniref:RteC protein n=1 Tax=Chitinophaga niastensis TaxID=536980 RepID=A0A2P8H9B7_CHINA|nr:RteC domain-containing protein [Chitinophaga niastensis]PSL42827.1 RteC protein [Chitinophaga niastensis]